MRRVLVLIGVLSLLVTSGNAMAQAGDDELMVIEGCKSGFDGDMAKSAKHGCDYAKRSIATDKRLAARKDATSHYGGDFTLKGFVDFQRLVANPKAYEGKTLKVESPIKSVCKKKGCWMVISDGKDDHNIRIRMKDYGFFVPKNCDGQTAVVEGVFAIKVLSEATVKHYEEDAGKDPAKVSGERIEMSMTATAIDIIK